MTITCTVCQDTFWVCESHPAMPWDGAAACGCGAPAAAVWLQADRCGRSLRADVVADPVADRKFIEPPFTVESFALDPSVIENAAHLPGVQRARRQRANRGAN